GESLRSAAGVRDDLGADARAAADHLAEKCVLGAEIRHHQSRGHPGLRGDGPDAHRVVPLRGEESSRRGQHGAAGALRIVCAAAGCRPLPTRGGHPTTLTSVQNWTTVLNECSKAWAADTA